MIVKILSLLLVCGCANSFPDGAPVDACVKDRANQPNHGQHRSQPLNTLPYRISASSANYGPNTQITVTIEGAEPFKGFFIQARSEQNEWLGSWEEAPNTTLIPECSAVTHADPREKIRATLVWKAPPSHGRVYFTLVSNPFRVLTHEVEAWWKSRREVHANRASSDISNVNTAGGTVLKNYGTFWANLVAEAPQDSNALQLLF